MAVMQTYGDGQRELGGCQSAALIGSYKQIRPISCYDLGVFLDSDGVTCNPMTFVIKLRLLESEALANDNLALPFCFHQFSLKKSHSFHIL